MGCLLDGIGINDSASDLQNCNTWCQHAISVSRFVDDDGILEKTVRFSSVLLTLF